MRFFEREKKILQKIIWATLSAHHVPIKLIWPHAVPCNKIQPCSYELLIWTRPEINDIIQVLMSGRGAMMNMTGYDLSLRVYKIMLIIPIYFFM